MFDPRVVKEDGHIETPEGRKLCFDKNGKGWVETWMDPHWGSALLGEILHCEPHAYCMHVALSHFALSKPHLFSDYVHAGIHTYTHGNEHDDKFIRIL